MTKRAYYLVLIPFALVFACAQGGVGDDDDAGADTGMDAQTGQPDSGPGEMDSGSRVDSGSGQQDAGDREPDAGPPDAGPPDAGPPDAGTDAYVCDETPCRLTPPHCGCVGGQSCYPTSSGRECAASGTTREGGTCSESTECQADMVCAADGRCRYACEDDADCTARGSKCTGSVTIGSDTVGTCSVGCEPAATGSTCPSAMACRYFGSDSSGYYTDCVAAGSSTGSCSSNADCERDYVCVTITSSNCHRSCRVGGSDCMFSSCQEFFNSDPTIEGTEYGFCPL